LGHFRLTGNVNALGARTAGRGACMKTTITIEQNDIKISFAPETELERLSIVELGDDISISRSHQSLVLRPRKGQVRRISDTIEREVKAEA
jgi:hypothetical protein